MTDVKRLANRDLLQQLAQAKADDPLWLELIARFRTGVRVTVLRTLRTEGERTPGLNQDAPPELTEDLAQEVFVKLLEGDRRALSRFEGRNELSAHTYLNTIAVNVVRDYCKSLRALRAPVAAVSLSGAPPAGSGSGARGPDFARTLVSDRPGPERFVASQELRTQIEAAIDEVAPRESVVARDRSIFQLFFVEGLTVDEIARNRSIGLSPSGVEKRIRRIRDTLREKLAAPLGGRSG